MSVTNIKHQRYRVEIRKKENDDIFSRRRQIVDQFDQPITEDIELDKLMDEIESTELIPYIKTAYSRSDCDAINKANKIMINNLFGKMNSFTIWDLQNNDIIDNMIGAFEKGSPKEAVQLGTILMNIIGIPDINITYYWNKGLFDSFYSKLFTPSQNPDLVKVCLFGIGNFSSEIEYIRDFLVSEGFFSHILMTYGHLMMTEEKIFMDFVWIASNCLTNLERSCVAKYTSILNILVDFILEIAKPKFPAACFLDTCMEYILDILDKLTAVPIYCNRLVESLDLQTKLNKLLLNTKHDTAVLRVLMRFVENSSIESFSHILAKNKIDNYAFVLKNSKKASVKIDILLLLSNLVLNEINWLLVVTNDEIMEIVVSTAVNSQTSVGILNELFFLMGNLAHGMNMKNYNLLLDTPVLEVTLKGFFIVKDKIRSILLEILSVILQKVYEIDQDSFNEIREEIVNSRFYERSHEIYNRLQSDLDRQKFEEIFSALNT